MKYAHLVVFTWKKSHFSLLYGHISILTTNAPASTRPAADIKMPTKWSKCDLFHKKHSLYISHPKHCLWAHLYTQNAQKLTGLSLGIPRPRSSNVLLPSGCRNKNACKMVRTWFLWEKNTQPPCSTQEIACECLCAPKIQKADMPSPALTMVKRCHGQISIPWPKGKKGAVQAVFVRIKICLGLNTLEFNFQAD